MPRFKSINFYKNILKIKLFTLKNAKFFVCWGLRPRNPVHPAAGGFAPDLLPPAAGGFAPSPPKHPPLRIFGYATDFLTVVMLFCVN